MAIEEDPLRPPPPEQPPGDDDPAVRAERIRSSLLSLYEPPAAMPGGDGGENSVFSPSTSSSTPPPSSSRFGCAGAGPVSNLCSATLGAGILSLPFAWRESGIVLGSTMLLFAGLATSASIDLLARSCQFYKAYSYETLIRRALASGGGSGGGGASAGGGNGGNGNGGNGIGNKPETNTGAAWWLSWLTQISLLLFCLGTAVAYVIAIGDILEEANMLLPLPLPLNHQWARPATICAAWVGLLLPLCLPRKMTTLAGFSAVGLASVATLVAAATLHLLQEGQGQGHEHQEGYHDGQLEERFPLEKVPYSRIARHWELVLWPSNGVLSVLKACPIILFAFACQVNVPAIYEELQVPPMSSQRSSPSLAPATRLLPAADADADAETPTDATDENESPQQGQGTAAASAAPAARSPSFAERKLRFMAAVTRAAVSACGLLYTGIAMVALADFAKLVKPNVLRNYDLGGGGGGTGGVMQVAAGAMAVAVVVAFPMNILPARRTAVEILSAVTSGGGGGGRRRKSGFCGCCRKENRTGSSAAATGAENDLTVPLLSTQQGQGGGNEVEEEQREQLSGMMVKGDATEQQQQTEEGNRNVKSETDAELSGDSIRAEGSLENVALDAEQGNADPHDSPISPDSTMLSSGVGVGSGDVVVHDDEDDELPCVQHVLLTVALAGFALGMALLVPDISVVFGLLGGTTASILGFIIPGVLGLQLAAAQLQKQQQHPAGSGSPATNEISSASAGDAAPQEQQVQDGQAGEGNSERAAALSTPSTDTCLVAISSLLLIGGIIIGIVTTGVTIYTTFFS